MNYGPLFCEHSRTEIVPGGIRCADCGMDLAPRFNGPVYEARFDKKRLTGQIRRIFDLMVDGHWRTLREIQYTTKDPPASISAQLRHLRKKRFGSHTVDKRHRGERCRGLWEYRLVPPGQAPILS